MWVGNGEVFHFISWQNICLPWESGGLGIFSLLVRRQACLCKSAAHLVLNPSSLWAQVINAKYHFMGSWDNYKRPPRCSSIWAKITAYGSKVQYQFQWKVGNGTSITFLYDPWMDAIHLKMWPTLSAVPPIEFRPSARSEITAKCFRGLKCKF